MRVVVIDSGYEDYAAERAALARLGAALEVFDGGRHDAAGKRAFAAGAAGLFLRWTELDGAFLDALGGLRAVVRYGVGYDNVDVAAATARGIPVCNVQGYATHSVSDHALALLLASVRGLGLAGARLRPDYGAPTRDPMPELRDLTLGIVGLGRIGTALCGKARALCRRVIACDPYVAAGHFAQHGAERVEFDALLAQSDAISVHCELNAETRGLFGRDAFARMRPGALFVNTARGPVVDEAALLEALETGRLYAAASDVFHDEPPGPNRDALLAHPHFLGTGHYAWFSTPASQRLQQRAADNMTALLEGRAPEDCLNPEVFGQG